MDNNQNFEAVETVNSSEKVSVNKAWSMVMTALKDKLFLVICILTSVSFGLGLLGESMDVIQLLFMIFLWMVFSNVKKGIVDTKSLRRVSGTVYATYIITYVACVALMAAGGLLGIMLLAFGDVFSEQLVTVDGAEWLIELLSGALAYAVVGALVAFALAGLLINIFGFKKIHTFAKSVYMGVDNSTTDFVKNAHGAKTWLWVFGVITLVEGFGYFADGKMMLELQCLVNAATYIVSAILVNKYLAEEQAQ
ncbi:MAG: hypothetical protein E7675_00825 [Ruminococcaceae bacterium]|nr:hypothetical protein [Oscillospiraceae bacterium]